MSEVAGSSDVPPPSTLVDDGVESVRPSRELCLRVVHAPAIPPVDTVSLNEQQPVVVGRDVGDRGLRVEDPKLSRLHFRIAWDGRQGAHRLGDANSANGTFLNGRPTTTSVLGAGDVIRAGGSLFAVDDVTRTAALHDQVRRAAASHLTVLLLGETGTGKELMARLVHEASGRSGAFVPVNCGAVPRELAAAEFFGHTKGAFSGAGGARTGLFAAARGGTLFLDEIGELPSELQPTLLRALQERKIRPVGAEREVEVDVRLVAATNRTLGQLAEEGEFRADLYARLAQLVVHLPALRERRFELLDLARELAGDAGGELTFSANVAEALLLWSWPYNVRELKSLAESHVALHGPGTELTLRLLEEQRPEIAGALVDRHRFRSSLPPTTTDSTRRNPLANRQRLEQLLERHQGNVSAVADEVGAHRTQVYRWMDRLGIERRRR